MENNEIIIEKRDDEQLQTTQITNGGENKNFLNNTHTTDHHHEMEKSNEARKREDKSLALKERKYFLETVVKGSLEKYTRKVQNVSFEYIDTNLIKRRVLECIESRISVFSKRAVRASMLINYYIRYFIKKKIDENNKFTDIELPKHIFDQTFIRQLFLGNKSCTRDFADFDDFVDKENLNNQIVFNDKDFGTRHLGDSNIYSFGAKKFIVNCQNHLILNFDSFINKYLYNIAYTKYKKEKFIKDLVYTTRSHIHKWDNLKVPESIKNMKQVIAFMKLEVDNIRTILRCKESDVINKKWMKDNLASILRLYAFILDKCEKENNEIKKKNKTNEENGVKKFTQCIKLFHLLPMHTIKPHFISIDDCVFEGLYKEVYSSIENEHGKEKVSKILPLMRKDWNSTKEMSHTFWNCIFDIHKLEGHNHTFSNHVGTDGKAIDFHYKRHVDLKGSFAKDLNDKLKKIEEKYKIEEDVESKKENENGKKPRKPKKLKTQEDEEKEAISKFLDGKRVLGLDPGRVTIMFLAEELDNGSKRSYKLSRCHYYRKSGILKSRKRTECWIRKNKLYKEGIALLSKNSIKSASWSSFCDALAIYNSYWNVFWEERMKMRWRSNNFDLFGGKKRVFQNFFNAMEKDNTCNKQTVISYGSARFSPTSKGEMAVPTSRSYKECASRYATFLTNEFRSTIVKYNDCTRLHHIRENITDKNEDKRKNKIKLSSKGDLRGLLWFSNQNTNNFVDRDLNGALNIRKFLFYGSIKPSIFTRDVKFEKEKYKDKKVLYRPENECTINKMIKKIKRSQKRKSGWKSPYKIVKR